MSVSIKRIVFVLHSLLLSFVTLYGYCMDSGHCTILCDTNPTNPCCMCGYINTASL